MLFKKRQFLQIKKEIQTRDGNNTWFYIERLQQLVWWLEDEKKQRGR